jgi:hypothetical protein
LAYLADADIAIADVREAVAALRWLGHKTVTGLYRIAAHCNVAPRRIRTLFHRDQTFMVTPAERRNLALSIADLFDHIADDCEAYADKCRDKSTAIRARERDQLNSPLGGNEWLGSRTSQRRRAA